MKRILVAIAGVALTGAAAAQTTAAPSAACIDPHKSYVARPLNNHEIFVQQSIGKPKPPIRVHTSCIDIHAALGFGFNAQYTCIGLGDTVVASINGGKNETCRVTKVMPYVPQDGDLKP